MNDIDRFNKQRTTGPTCECERIKCQDAQNFSKEAAHDLMAQGKRAVKCVVPHQTIERTIYTVKQSEWWWGLNKWMSTWGERKRRIGRKGEERIGAYSQWGLEGVLKTAGQRSACAVLFSPLSSLSPSLSIYIRLRYTVFMSPERCLIPHTQWKKLFLICIFVLFSNKNILKSFPWSFDM